MLINYLWAFSQIINPFKIFWYNSFDITMPLKYLVLDQRYQLTFEENWLKTIWCIRNQNQFVPTNNKDNKQLDIAFLIWSECWGFSIMYSNKSLNLESSTGYLESRITFTYLWKKKASFWNKMSNLLRSIKEFITDLFDSIVPTRSKYFIKLGRRAFNLFPWMNSYFKTSLRWAGLVNFARGRIILSSSSHLSTSSVINSRNIRKTFHENGFNRINGEWVPCINGLEVQRSLNGLFKYLAISSTMTAGILLKGPVYFRTQIQAYFRT